MSDENNNKPDFYVYFYEPTGRNSTRRIQVGAAWKHENGDGLSISLDALPIREFDGSLVIFPPLKTDQKNSDNKQKA